jgi:hypothetical protein
MTQIDCFGIEKPIRLVEVKAGSQIIRFVIATHSPKRVCEIRPPSLLGRIRDRNAFPYTAALFLRSAFRSKYREIRATLLDFWESC